MHIPAHRLEDHVAATMSFGEILSELRESPQVESASAIIGMPTGKYNSDGGHMIEGQPKPKDLNPLPEAGFRVSSPGFFATMRIPIQKGNDFNESDLYNKPFVSIVNGTLATGEPRRLASLVKEIAARRNPGSAAISFASLLLVAMATLALVQAVAALYGVLAHLASQRLSEFGLRVALGAQSGDIVALVWREAELILGLGFAIGLALVIALGSTVRSFLFGVEPTDPVSIGLAIGVLGIAALVASLVPSLGARKADPMTVLRSE